MKLINMYLGINGKEKNGKLVWVAMVSVRKTFITDSKKTARMLLEWQDNAVLINIVSMKYIPLKKISVLLGEFGMLPFNV